MVVVVETCLALQSEFMEGFETVKGEDCLWMSECCRKPFLTEQLDPC